MTPWAVKARRVCCPSCKVHHFDVLRCVISWPSVLKEVHAHTCTSQSFRISFKLCRRQFVSLSVDKRPFLLFIKFTAHIYEIQEWWGCLLAAHLETLPELRIRDPLTFETWHEWVAQMVIQGLSHFNMWHGLSAKAFATQIHTLCALWCGKHQFLKQPAARLVDFCTE